MFPWRFRTLKTPSLGNFWPQNPLLRPFLSTPLRLYVHICTKTCLLVSSTIAVHLIPNEVKKGFCLFIQIEKLKTLEEFLKQLAIFPFHTLLDVVNLG